MHLSIDHLAKSILQKESLAQCSIDELKQLIDEYPYFGAAQLLFTKKLQIGDKDEYDRQLQKTSLLFHNPLWLEYLLNDQQDFQSFEEAFDSTPDLDSKVESLQEHLEIESFPTSSEEKPDNIKEPTQIEADQDMDLSEFGLDRVDSKETELTFLRSPVDEHTESLKQEGEIGAITNSFEKRFEDIESASHLDPHDSKDSELISHQSATDVDAKTDGKESEITPITESLEQRFENFEPSRHDQTDAKDIELSAFPIDPDNSIDPELTSSQNPGGVDTFKEELEGEPITESLDQRFESIESSMDEHVDVQNIELSPFNMDPHDSADPQLASPKNPSDVDAPTFKEELEIEAITESSEQGSDNNESSMHDQAELHGFSKDSDSFSQTELNSKESFADFNAQSVGQTQETQPFDESSENDSGSTEISGLDQPDLNVELPSLKIESIDAEKAQLIFEPYHTVDYFASQGIKFKAEETPTDKFGQQLKSFTDWLKTLKRLPVKEIVQHGNANTELKVEQLAGQSLQDNEVVTETMAEVWKKQGNFEKALNIYNKLSLLDPSKRVYFAAKIEELKKNN